MYLLSFSKYLKHIVGDRGAIQFREYEGSRLTVLLLMASGFCNNQVFNVSNYR